MVIKKVLNLENKEFNLLVEAGKLLGSIRDSRTNFAEYSDGVKGILESLSTVINECLSADNECLETKPEQ